MPDTPNGEGVLSRPALGAYRTLVFVGGWFVAGIIATIAVLSLFGFLGHSTLDAKVDQLIKDMQAVKCRLNIENTCPSQDTPVRASGVGR